jgi:hypothetical protein
MGFVMEAVTPVSNNAITLIILHISLSECGFFSKKLGLVASISRGLRAVIDIIWISSSLEIAKQFPVKLSLLHQMAIL